MIIEYTDCHVHRIRLDLSDLQELPVLYDSKSVADFERRLLDAALLVIGEVRKDTKTYVVLCYQNNKIWLNGYDK